MEVNKYAKVFAFAGGIGLDLLIGFIYGTIGNSKNYILNGEGNRTKDEKIGL